MPILYAPLSDHNLVITELQYNETWLDFINFKKLLFYFLKNKSLIVEPDNIRLFQEAFIPGNLVELPFKVKKPNPTRVRKPLTLKKVEKNNNNNKNKKSNKKSKNKKTNNKSRN